MKTIAITQRLVENTAYPETRDALDIRWAQLCKELGYLPVLLPTYFSVEPYFRSLIIDGVILTGGNDLSCVSDDALSGKRDAFEKKLISIAIGKRIPILGVCRGMQLLSDYFHGTLGKVSDHANTKHPLEVSDKSKYRKTLKKLNVVNSYHNFAIKTLPGDFVISARSREGVIEAIEHKKYPIFGQMWHPERETPFRKADLRLIKDVLQ